MDDASQRQQYKINAMHGHDVGVWVCEGSGISLSPVLFMQAICPEPAPRPLLVKWKSTTVPPRPFSKDGALPLVYSDCGRLPAWPYYVHLFAPQAPIAHELEQTSSLHDWQWTVPVIGIVVIFNEKYDRPPSALSFDGLFKRTQPHKLSPALAWAQEQHLPCVIAALGYDATSTSLQQFRQHYELAPEVPVVLGPAPIDARLRNQDTSSGMFSTVFTHQKLTIDRDYAKAVLDNLLRQIDREQ
ncbi:MAG TPA: hypothetical protein VMP08_09165 [Anaerolineae bacterium]|nr:hypothetical protein [Anaerolineae bacterium]